MVVLLAVLVSGAAAATVDGAFVEDEVSDESEDPSDFRLKLLTTAVPTMLPTAEPTAEVTAVCIKEGPDDTTGAAAACAGGWPLGGGTWCTGKPPGAGATG